MAQAAEVATNTGVAGEATEESRPPAVSGVGAKAPAGPRSAKPRKMVALVVLAVIACTGARYAYDARLHEETDDAQIDGDIATVSPRITGTVKQVLVSENETVKVGQLLAILDTRELDIALASAKANLAQAEALLRAEDPGVSVAETSTQASLANAKSDVAAASADITAAMADRKRFMAELSRAESNKKLAALELERVKKLVDSGASTGSELDSKTAAFEAASAAVDAAKQGVSAADAKIAQGLARGSAASTKQLEAKENAPRVIEVRKAMLDVQRANVESAKAQVAQAELNLEHAKIVAPVAGIVGRKAVVAGDRVAPGQQLFAITEIDHVWVTANFRETQLRLMAPNQPVTVHVDALDKDFKGVIESLPGATGSRFALLPPENASGNYVKVVQRMPVRIRLEANQPDAWRLRPGMSVEPKVKVR